MGTIRSHKEAYKTGPSTFALLVDDISKLSESEQKVLRLQLNLDKVSALAKKLDASVIPHNLSSAEIDALITEARKNGKHKKD
jgi:preprotein translocase subunit SecA